jgi:hypothetical protein
MIESLTALIFSLIAPGSGQVFNGQYFKAGFFAFIFIFGRCVILPLIIRIFKFKDDISALKLIYIFNIIYPILIIISAVDAAYFATNISHNARGAFYAICALFIISTTYRALSNKFIVYSMSGREDLVKYILTSKNSQRQNEQQLKNEIGPDGK